MRTIVAILCAALLALTGCGAGTGSATGAAGLSLTAAVLPFENLSGDPNAGLIISDNLSSSLSASDALIPPATVRQQLGAFEGQYLPPQQIGKMLGADAVITGTVTEYRYVYGAGEQPAVSFNLRVLDSASGAVLFAREYSASGNLSWLKQDSLGQVGTQLARKAAADLRRELASRTPAQ